MPCLIKRSNGIYYQVTTVHGKRIWKSTGCTSRQKALSCLESLDHLPIQQDRNITLEQFCAPLFDYLATNVAPSTLLLYRSAFASFNRIIGDHPLRHYTPLHVEQYKSKRASEVSTVKVNIDFRMLRAAFNHAINWSFLTENPFRKSKQLRMAPLPPTYLRPEDYKTLMIAIDKLWYRDLVRFAVATMMRLNEIINLRWESINLAERTIIIENNRSFHTKTRRNRSIPIEDGILQWLEGKREAAGYIFSWGDGLPYSKGHVSRLFKRYVRKAGLSDELHFHSLRHTGATWLVQNNVPIFSVKKILGHSNIATTEMYSHMGIQELITSTRAIKHLL